MIGRGPRRSISRAGRIILLACSSITVKVKSHATSTRRYPHAGARAHRPHSRGPQRHGPPLFGKPSASHDDLRQTKLPLCPRSRRSTRPVLSVGTHERRKARQSHGLARASRTSATCHRQLSAGEETLTSLGERNRVSH